MGGSAAAYGQGCHPGAHPAPHSVSPAPAVSRLNCPRDAATISSRPALDRPLYWEKLMAWTSPKVVEISLGCEINCYACAEIKA
ncbi:pyrroloquinoline quinone precursor peptide PqqA [Phenylobacterium deserti]